MQLRQLGVMFAVIALAKPLAAQMFGPKVPTLSGIWHPAVGTGAAYEITKAGRKSQIEISIIGKEDVDGKTGFWQEFAMTDQNTSQMMYGKTLVSGAEDGAR